MKQRIISLLILTALLIALLPQGLLAVSAYSDTEIAYPVEGGNIYFDKETGAITDCDDSVTNADIPAEIEGVIVSSIDIYAFSGCSNLVSVTIPDSVVSIGDGAFWLCSSLTNIKISANVTSIGGASFSGCSSLISVTIPGGVTSIGYQAFYSCSSLSDVMIPNSVMRIGSGAFYNTAIYNTEDQWTDNILYISDWLIEARKTISGDCTIVEGTRGIADAAFWSCSDLTSITIPNTVTSISNSSFSDCSSLESVTIPDGVTVISDGAFHRCTSLVSVTIPNTVTSIGSGAFYGCNSLVNVTIPDSVSGIGASAFYGCSSLISVIIPDGVTSIGPEMFTGCSSLISVMIPGSVTSIGSYALQDCSSLASVTIPSSVTRINWSAFKGCSSLTSITIPEGVTKIESDTFHDCNSLTSVTIPEGVTSIANSAFENCSSLPSVTIPDSVIFISSCAFRGCSSLTSVIIPEGVTSIMDSTFSGCGNLVSVSIPDGVTSIGYGAFYNCSSLTNLTIPNGVTSIDFNTFNGCSSLTDMIIPASVTSFGSSSFEGCNSLCSVYFLGDAPELSDDVFKTWDEGTQTYINIPGLTLYYIEGKEGWTSPTWNGYPTATWKPAHEHTYTETVTAPTCTEQGYTTHICSVCGDSYVDTYVDALGDDFGEWTQMKAPTCTEKGSEKRACSRCDTFETREIDALGHKYENGVCVQCGEKDPNEQPTIEFVDVPQKAWYVEAVNYAVQNGLMNGVGNDQFNPEGSMTRAMLVTVLWRYEGQPKAGENTFSDVPNGQWYTNAVAWAAKNGIVGGVGNNRFDPNGEITREQMATILYRYAKKKGIDTGKRGDLSAFPDGSKVESWAKDAVQWTVAEQIINGSDGKLLPQGNATRAQVATILMRFIENNVK